MPIKPPTADKKLAKSRRHGSTKSSVPEFPKVTTTDYYRQYEGIEGLDFQDGQQILVKWPNSEITTEILKVVYGSGSAQVDMNNYPDHFQTRKLYVARPYNGAEALISLKGLGVSINAQR